MFDKAYVLLYSEIYRYKNGYFKKWMCMALGLILGTVIMLPIVIQLPNLFFAWYDRSGLEEVAKSKFIDTNTGRNLTFDDIIVDDLLIPSFEWNQYEPRFFSKYLRNQDPGVYNLNLW